MDKPQLTEAKGDYFKVALITGSTLEVKLTFKKEMLLSELVEQLKTAEGVFKLTTKLSDGKSLKRLTKLNLKENNSRNGSSYNRFSDEQAKIIKDNYKKMTTQQIADKLGVDKKRVDSRIHYMKAKKEL